MNLIVGPIFILKWEKEKNKEHEKKDKEVEEEDK